MVFRNVIVCRMVPGSEDKIAKVFGHYDKATRPQDFGVIGRILMSHHDLYIHIVERNEDPAVSGQNRGLPAFKEIAEAIGPYVTPYPRGGRTRRTRSPRSSTDGRPRPMPILTPASGT